MTPLLQFESVSFHYPDRPVLDGVSLSLAVKSCVALIGPNGSGKTTILRLASGALTPSAGNILLDGSPVAKMRRRELSRLVALVPQHLEVPFEFTVQQMVEQGRAPYLGVVRGLTREDRQAVDQALESADLCSIRNRIFNELSGGERQRVKIALGLAQQPKLLLLDEPTQNLDVGRQLELIDLLHSLCDSGITIFASIHDLHLVPDNFTTVHLLEAGSSLTSGAPELVLQANHLARAFRYPASRHPLLMINASMKDRA